MDALFIGDPLRSDADGLLAVENQNAGPEKIAKFKALERH